MCCRYLLTVAYTNKRLCKFIEICNQFSDSSEQIPIADSLQIHPNDSAPVLTISDFHIQAASMRWGFPGKGGGLVINARSEDVQFRPMFRNLLAQNRCAIPASGYYEWRDGDRQKYLIAPSSGEGIYLAGLYQMDENGKMRFVILTRSAFGAHARIHGRMPLVLSSVEEAKQWISGTLALEALSARETDSLRIQPLGAEQLRMDL